MDIWRPSKLGFCSTLARSLEIGGHPLQDLDPELGVGHLPTAEHHGQLDLVPFLQKAPRVAQLEIVVVLLDAGPELHFLDLDRVLFSAEPREPPALPRT